MLCFAGARMNGSNMLFQNVLRAVFKVSCRFDLRRYPFTSQRCGFVILLPATFGIDLNLGEEYPNGEMKIPPHSVVGEFEISKITTEIDGASADIYIDFDSVYGYHLLNSYLPSFLLFIISFATFFFKTDEFNERIMISLTSMLVLTALFAQANDSSIATPEVTLLDVWYAALIVFTFLITMANTGINRFKNRIMTSADYSSPREMKKVDMCNRICAIIILVLFVIFFVLYILAAGNVI